MAAIQAAQQGASVTILEHNEKTGRKICVTGNGRCNLTNLNQYEGAYRGKNPEFVNEIFRQFSLTDTLDFFEKIGILTVEKKGWLYPRSGQAKSVSELLEAKARSLKIKIKTREHVTKVFPKDRLWNVQTEGWTYQGAAVILANGSKASAVSGSDGSGYEIATALGHQIIPPLPALLGLKCRDRGFSSWSGVRNRRQAYPSDRWGSLKRRGGRTAAYRIRNIRNSYFSAEPICCSGSQRKEKSCTSNQLFSRVYRRRVTDSDRKQKETLPLPDRGRAFDRASS